VGQPRMIPLLSHQHLGCDSCMAMFQTEIFQFAGRSFTCLLMRTCKRKVGAPSFHNDFQFAQFNFWISFWNFGIVI